MLFATTAAVDAGNANVCICSYAHMHEYVTRQWQFIVLHENMPNG